MKGNKKYRLHPEVEKEIRFKAREFVVACMQSDKDIYAKSAERGAISFDDIYFVGITNAAGSVALENLVETKQVPMVECETVDGVFSTADEGDPAFRDLLNERENYLTSLLYGISSQEAGRRYSEIHIKITQDHNDSLRER